MEVGTCHIVVKVAIRQHSAGLKAGVKENAKQWRSLWSHRLTLLGTSWLLPAFVQRTSS